MIPQWAIRNPQLFWSSLNDELVRRLAIARLVAFGRQAPRRHRVPAARRLALAAAERMVDRVHRHAPHVGTLSQPAAAAGFADRHVLVIVVADLAEGGKALHVALADLTGRHLHRGIVG